MLDAAEGLAARRTAHLRSTRANRIEPPGIISYETIDLIVAKLDETLSEVAEEFSLNSRQ